MEGQIDSPSGLRVNPTKKFLTLFRKTSFTKDYNNIFYFIFYKRCYVHIFISIVHAHIAAFRNLFGQEKEDYYKPVRGGNLWSKNYNEYESNGDRNKARSIQEYLNKIRPYLKDIINDLKKSDTQKI